MHRPLLAAAGLALSLTLAAAFSSTASAQAPAALTGLVSSADETAMEGVLVSATKAGSNITVTVVTGADGRYSFPASRLGPGQYILAVRAVGYELEPSQAIDIKGIEAPDQKAETKDLRLGKAKDLAAQLSNGEWLASIPGTDRQKDQLLNCVGCHRVERIMRSKYDAEGFLTQILPRMQGYVQQSLSIHPQLRPAERSMEEQGENRIQLYRAASSI